MDEKSLTPINCEQLNENTNDIAQQIVDCNTSVDDVKNLINLFNLNQQKKNVVRVLKLNGLLDKVADQMVERFEKKPGEFSNADLLAYMSTVQGALEKAQKSVDMVQETPTIQITQNNNINISETQPLSRESRERILDAIKSIMNKPIEADYEDKTRGVDDEYNKD